MSNGAHVDGPLTHETVGSSIAVSLALAVVSPLILLYAIVTGIGMLAQGSVPVTGRRLWSERAGTRTEPQTYNLPIEWRQRRISIDDIEGGLSFEPFFETPALYVPRLDRGM